MRDGRPSCPYAGAASPNTALNNMRHTYFTRFCILKQYVSGYLGLCCCTLLYQRCRTKSCAVFLFISQMPCQNGGRKSPPPAGGRSIKLSTHGILEGGRHNVKFGGYFHIPGCFFE